MTQDRLKELLHYDPETGIFTWLVTTSNRVHAGDIAGSPCSQGYVDIGLDGKLYRAHRLVWLYMTGKWPRKHIDHIDRNGYNNKFLNLREVTRSQNQSNRSHNRNKKSRLPKGVFQHNENTWRAKITANGKQIHLGLFGSVEEAYEAYCEAVRIHHGEFGRMA